MFLDNNNKGASLPIQGILLFFTLFGVTLSLREVIKFCSETSLLKERGDKLSVVGPLFFISFTVYGIVSVFALRAHKKGTKGASTPLYSCTVS